MPTYAVFSTLIKKENYETKVTTILETHRADSENEAKGKFVTSVLKDYVDVRFTDILCSKVDIQDNHEGEVVVTKNDEGQILAVTRQDEEGRVLKVIATNDKPIRNPLAYAGVVVWVGSQQCSQYLTEIEYKQGGFASLDHSFNLCYNQITK